MEKRTDGICIGICEFIPTGRQKKTPSKKKEEKKCTACGFIAWIDVKEKKDE